MINKTFRGVTNISAEFGIIEKEKTDSKTGEIKKDILLTKQAQNYILNNLEDILSDKE